jgi:cytoskeletal protein CcmA (bactofilin family)
MLDRQGSVSPPTNGGGTFLGTDVEFKGSLKFGDRLRIDGRFEGELTSSGTLHVGPQGDVRADVDVGGAVVEGSVEGNIIASDRVELRSTARMTGDVRASKLIVEEGVVFLGRCEVGPDKTGASSNIKKRKAEPEPEPEPQQSEIEIGLGT